MCVCVCVCVCACACARACMRVAQTNLTYTPAKGSGTSLLNRQVPQAPSSVTFRITSLKEISRPMSTGSRPLGHDLFLPPLAGSRPSQSHPCHGLSRLRPARADAGADHVLHRGPAVRWYEHARACTHTHTHTHTHKHTHTRACVLATRMGRYLSESALSESARSLSASSESTLSKSILSESRATDLSAAFFPGPPRL